MLHFFLSEQIANANVAGTQPRTYSSLSKNPQPELFDLSGSQAKNGSHQPNFHIPTIAQSTDNYDTLGQPEFTDSQKQIFHLAATISGATMASSEGILRVNFYDLYSNIDI